ncbi:MAG: hypothetical protein QXH59_09670 [Candidatus Caldarchaeum sp.]
MNRKWIFIGVGLLILFAIFWPNIPRLTGGQVSVFGKYVVCYPDGKCEKISTENPLFAFITPSGRTVSKMFLELWAAVKVDNPQSIASASWEIRTQAPNNPVSWRQEYFCKLSTGTMHRFAESWGGGSSGVIPPELLNGTAFNLNTWTILPENYGGTWLYQAFLSQCSPYEGQDVVFKLTLPAGLFRVTVVNANGESETKTLDQQVVAEAVLKYSSTQGLSILSLEFRYVSP